MRIHWLLPVAVALTPTLIRADDLPKPKPGLWEITGTSDRDNGQSHVMKMCTDNKTQALFSHFGDQMGKDKCSKRDVQNQGTQVVTDTVCNIAQSQVTSHAVMTFDNPTSFSIKVQSRYEPALFGRTESNSTQTGKWVGACPADMKPGDVLSPNGVRINLNAVLESKPQ